MKGRIPTSPGTKFGLLTVVSLDGIWEGPGGKRGVHRTRLYLCNCECGQSKTVREDILRRGHCLSCGCLQRRKKYGFPIEDASGKFDATYLTWVKMRGRCNFPSDRAFRSYGAKGVRICERWGDYLNFLSDMGPRPGDGWSIDRIDPEGNYEPSNCQWLPMEINRRKHRYHTVTTDTASKAKALFLAGARPCTIGRKLSLSTATISGIVNGNTWNWVPVDRDYLLALTSG